MASDWVAAVLPLQNLYSIATKQYPGLKYVNHLISD